MPWTALELIEVLQEAVDKAGKDIPVKSLLDGECEIEVSTEVDAAGIPTEVVIEALVKDEDENE